MIIDPIKNGIVIDHIKAGKGKEIYDFLQLDELNCTVALIKNVPSKKTGKKDIIKIDDKTYNVSADMPIDDLYELLELGKAPESSYTNVGGFLYSLAEKIPTEGEVLTWDSTIYTDNEGEMVEEKLLHLMFTILEVRERRIIRAKLEIIEDQNDESLETEE
jgi:CBS domain containing-hemolysin-like protein